MSLLTQVTCQAVACLPVSGCLALQRDGRLGQARKPIRFRQRRTRRVAVRSWGHLHEEVDDHAVAEVGLVGEETMPGAGDNRQLRDG